MTMAVTLLLARVSQRYLDAYAAAVDPGDPEGAYLAWDPPDGWTDLDWSSGALVESARYAGLGPEPIAALGAAVGGDPAVDVSFVLPGHPWSAFGRPAAVGPVAVARTARTLGRIDWPGVMAALPDADGEAIAALGGVCGLARDPRGYLSGHFAALRELYETAAHHGQFVVLWWD
ncbi:DUF1877 domain-containing protein [Streptomyces sp. NPDC007988]|uniref:DUF1877 domain-containing protein n=1 Tax=Streptomyces sp. NPDC007988 TaxID=3364802 RepID=UPI0036E96683